MWLFAPIPVLALAPYPCSLPLPLSVPLPLSFALAHTLPLLLPLPLYQNRQSQSSFCHFLWQSRQNDANLFNIFSAVSFLVFVNTGFFLLRYAVNYLEAVNSTVQSQEEPEDEEETNELPLDPEEELENIKRLKEEEEDRMSEDDKLLFYEVVS